MHIDRHERMFFMASALLLVVFALAVGISGFVYGIQVPQPVGLVDPKTVATPRLKIQRIAFTPARSLIPKN